jgi:hypothetical protein
MLKLTASHISHLTFLAQGHYVARVNVARLNVAFMNVARLNVTRPNVAPGYLG